MHFELEMEWNSAYENLTSIESQTITIDLEELFNTLFAEVSGFQHTEVTHFR